MNKKFPFTLRLDITTLRHYTAWSHRLFTRADPSILNQLVRHLSHARKIQSLVTEKSRKVKPTKELTFRDQHDRGPEVKQRRE